MARLTPREARELAADHGIPLGKDFHALTSAEVESVLTAARSRKYSAPANRNGSPARYFHNYLRRAADSQRSE